MLEELGRTLATTPLLGNAVLAAQALLGGGDETACRRLLPGHRGRQPDRGTRLDRRGRSLGGADRHGERGRPRMAAGRRGAPRPRRPHRRHPAGRRRVGSIAGVTSRCAASGSTSYRPSPEPWPGCGWTALRRGASVRWTRTGCGTCAALAAEQVSAAGALELPVGYAETGVHSIGYAAAAGPDLAPVAKVHCSEGLRHVAAEMIQLHGGIAITWEHDAHLYLKRAHGAAHLFGSPRDHVARLSGQLTTL